MNALRNLVLVAGALSLTGCNAFTSFSEVRTLNNTEAVGSPFTIALADEYRDFSNNQLMDFFDYPDALHFARKGLAAAAGEEIMPEPIGDWNLNDGNIQELAAARGRLLVAFELGARNVAPALTARAQAKFDCWIEETEEHWTNDSESDCKSQFFETMNALEGKLQSPPPAAPLPVPVPAPVSSGPTTPLAPEDAMYLVFFDWDSSAITGGASKVLEAVAQEVNGNTPSQINIVGHADTSGSKIYNQRLALRRATEIRDALVNQGIDQGLISIESMGETDLLVPTPDNVREPANRRGNISFE